MTKPKETPKEDNKKSKPQKELTVVDIWRRSGKTSAKNETDVLLEAIVDKIGLK